MEFEGILAELGGFGCYQIFIFVAVSLLEVPAAWSMLLPIFIQAEPQACCNWFDTMRSSKPDLNLSASAAGSYENGSCVHYDGRSCSEFGECPNITYSAPESSTISEVYT